MQRAQSWPLRWVTTLGGSTISGAGSGRAAAGAGRPVEHAKHTATVAGSLWLCAGGAAGACATRLGRWRPGKRPRALFMLMTLVRRPSQRPPSHSQGSCSLQGLPAGPAHLGHGCAAARVGGPGIWRPSPAGYSWPCRSTRLVKLQCSGDGLRGRWARVVGGGLMHTDAVAARALCVPRCCCVVLCALNQCSKMLVQPPHASHASSRVRGVPHKLMPCPMNSSSTA